MRNIFHIGEKWIPKKSIHNVFLKTIGSQYFCVVTLVNGRTVFSRPFYDRWDCELTVKFIEADLSDESN